jgi:UPF0716 family protein affecting phage T7 exclusion
MKIGGIRLDWRLGGGVVLFAGALFILNPGLVRAILPLLVVAACPLAMVLMMRGMGDKSGSQSGRSRPPTHRAESDPHALTSASADLGQLRQELDDLAARQAFITMQLQALETNTSPPRSSEVPPRP